MSPLRQWLGSILFTAYLFVSLPVYACWLLIRAPFCSRAQNMRIAVAWADSVLYLLRKLCRLDYVVEGEQYLQGQNSVLLMKHSSAWETIAQFKLFPEQTWVIKRQLMWAPFLGWALAFFDPIAIDRRAGRDAVEQVLSQGRARLEEGLWVVIFPEGTRVPVGQTGRYGLSGALLATSTGRAVVPVAHNAGAFWPRRGWLKRPGTVRVVIGPPIPSTGRSARDLNHDVRSWIEATIATMAEHAAPRG
ncbi:MAG: lysophospholipid acyltransferase family protein [Rhodospirillaceae bacterium]|nr:lysophospholipid acyltransferase family protein [Rhodospirillaceae bacterium]